MNNVETKGFHNLCNDELQATDGGVVVAGLVITGAMVIKGIGCLAAGVTFGTVIGKTIKGIIG